MLEVAGQRTRAFFNSREVIGWQGRQGETAASGLDHNLLLVELDVDQRVVRQALADIHELASGYGDFAWLGRLFQLNTANQFHFQVCTGQ
ncbi:hypothetical protein D9M71_671870 [compost metagenome]